MLRRDPLLPPRRRQRYGRAEFLASGDELLGRLLDAGGLQPGSRVLDVGCGYGRIARPLTTVLDPARGSYDGFDVDRETIGWCRRAYARRHPHFRFLRADLFHPRFHPGGAHRAAGYRFPYEDGAFDLVIASGVLTHLLEEEAAHYVAESGRVLAPGGRLFATVFALDDESRAQIAGGAAGMDFLDPQEHVAVVSDDLPEEAVAYDAGWLGERLTEAGLELQALRPGSWRGIDETAGLLDELVAHRA